MHTLHAVRLENFSSVCTPPLQLTRDNATKESAEKSILIAHLRQEVQEHLSSISECQSKVREGEAVRRKLLSMVFGVCMFSAYISTSVL